MQTADASHDSLSAGCFIARYFGLVGAGHARAPATLLS